MKVGIPKEIKNNENRVGMTPAGVATMTARGHEVFVQHTAGDGSGFSDDEYVGAGAKIVPNTSTLALTNATLRYALSLADKGWRKACKDDSSLAKGLNIAEGKVVYKAVADVFGLPYEPLAL